MRRPDPKTFGAVLAGLSVLLPTVNYAFHFVPMTDWVLTSAPNLLTAIATLASLFVYVWALSRQPQLEARREHWRRLDAGLTFFAGLIAILGYVYYLDRAEQIVRSIGPTPAEDVLLDRLFWILPALYAAGFSAVTRGFCLIVVQSVSDRSLPPTSPSR